MKEQPIFQHQKNWIQIRKQLLVQIKKQVALRLGENPQELQSYYEDYQLEFKKKWHESRYDELYHHLIHRSQVVLGGDFHAYAQSQRAHLRVLRQIVNFRQVILALECFESKDQIYIDKYLKGKLTEKEFLKKIKWDRRWGFKWSFYKPLVDFAKKKQIQIVGVNYYYDKRNHENLCHRDQHASEVLFGLTRVYPHHLIYCVYGDLHLAESHLPRYMKQFDSSIVVTAIFQNSETLYFQLARKNLETRVDVLKSSQNQFCIITSPPWVKWQSYLIFLEENYDSDLNEEMEYTDYVKEQILFLAKDLKLKVNTDSLGVYTSGDSYIGQFLSQPNLSQENQVIRNFIKNDWSFYLPKMGLMYLSRMTVNHSATLAGYFIQAQYSLRNEFPWQMPKDFESSIWLEAIGYFFSKIINHKRKTESLSDLKTQLSATQTKEGGREALLLALDQRLCELLIQQGHKNLKRKFHPKSQAVYFEAARILGHMLGEKIFLAYKMERISSSEIKEYLNLDIFSSQFLNTYHQVVKKVEDMSVPTSLGGVVYG